jgi:iron complex transport system ATP-binding protein
MLSAREISVTYRGAAAPALDRVSFSVEPHRFAALVGPNGSGKTTLVQTLLGILPPTQGELTLDGRPLARWSAAERAMAVGFLPQREESHFGWKVDEVVMFGRYARLGPLAPPSRADLAAAHQAMIRADVAHLAARPIDALSGGEWQRVRIARALAQEPRILVLDEPNAGLDLGHEMEIFELVRALVDEGLAALVVTHDLNLAARFADRMTVLHDGHVVAEGSPNEVMRQDLLERVFGWPMRLTLLPDGVPQLVPERRAERPRIPPTEAG